MTPTHSVRAARQRTRRIERKIWVQDQKRVPCMDCGQSFPSECMDFDHRDPSQKRFQLSSHGHYNFSIAVLSAEIAKCDIVCSNCHRIRTSERKDYLRGNRRAAAGCPIPLLQGFQGRKGHHRAPWGP